jgi:hypothetical protein
MTCRRIAILTAALFSFAFMSFAQQKEESAPSTAEVSKKQDIAVFALGYHGFDIPQETLATVDAEIQGVFVNLGRFNVFGNAERFSSKDAQAFIDSLKNLKEKSVPLPEELKFGEIQMTQALYDKLYGAFVVVIPTVTDYNSQYNKSQNQYETTLRTSFAFINVATGSTFGFANITTSGSSKETKYKSVKGAVDMLAPMLSFEIRKIDAFTLRTKALRVRGSEVKMQLGKDMGIQVGDEFAVIDSYSIDGLVDEEEDGLIIIKNVGPQISTGRVVYAGNTLDEGAQLREIPRLGIELAPYLRYLTYFEEVNGNGGALVLGAKAVATRYFYRVRPMVGVQMSFDTDLWLPVAAYFGGEFNLFLGRFSLYGSAAIGGASNVVFKYVEEALEEATDSADDDSFVSHYGFLANAGLSVLISRDVKIFAEVGIEYWASVLNDVGGPFANYGGTGITVGAAFKL